MLPVVQDYLLKCKKAYLIEVIRMKFKDESKSLARDVIVTDMACLIEGCASANPIVAQFCLVIIEEYISIIPELAIYTKILLVFAECISALYHRMNK